MHQLMMTSTAYRQSSHISDRALEIDPQNKLLSRMQLRRMSAEALYDSILRATGRLDPTPFGPPDQVTTKGSGEIVVNGTKEGWRRAVYVLKRRKTPPTLLDVFDSPQLTPNCTERSQSTVATQALQMMNGATVRGHARYLAARLMDAFPNHREDQIEQLYLRTLTRPPTLREVESAHQTLDDLAAKWRNHLDDENDDAPRAFTAQWSALGSLAHALLSSAEFLYVD